MKFCAQNVMDPAEGICEKKRDKACSECKQLTLCSPPEPTSLIVSVFSAMSIFRLS